MEYYCYKICPKIFLSQFTFCQATTVYCLVQSTHDTQELMIDFCQIPYDASTLQRAGSGETLHKIGCLIATAFVKFGKQGQ